MTRLLIISPDVIGEQMAGVGIRCWNLAAAVSRHGIRVTLAIPGDERIRGEGFEVVLYNLTSYLSLEPHLRNADVVLISGYVLASFPQLRHLDVPIVVDLWAPYVLENLEVFADRSLEAQMEMHDKSVMVVSEQLRIGDFFICASEKQRDFWLGMLIANNRINPRVYAHDPTLYSLLDVVPFGLPAEPPRHTHQVLKGVMPGIAATDKVILWSGGIWEWYDPLTLIRATQQVVAVRQDVKLVFLGVKHPNSAIFASHQLGAAIDLSRELGLDGRHVFFADWAPYDEMQNYLLEADLGTVLHQNHLETRFSFRARVLSFLWARLPILITEGSPSSDIVRDAGLGRVVDYADVAGTTEAILDMLSQHDLRAQYHPRFEGVLERYRWDSVVRPVVGFCRSPHRAYDKGHTSAQLGDPYLRSELDRLQALVDGYERGRFIRFARWLHGMGRRFKGGR